MADCTPNVDRHARPGGRRPPVQPAAGALAPAVAAGGEVVILVAEDDPITQKLTLLQLESLGYRAEAVGNGCEAVAAATARPYTLVLMDCQMPRMDGWAAAAAIRQTERSRVSGGYRRLPIVAVTANSSQNAREGCLAAGMDDYLLKPFDIDQLRQVVERWLHPDV